MASSIRVAVSLLPDFVSAASTAYLLLNPTLVSEGQMMGLFLCLVLFELLAAGACIAVASGLHAHGGNAYTLAGATAIVFAYLMACVLAYEINGAWQVAFATVWLLAAKLSGAWSAGRNLRERARVLHYSAIITAVCWFIYIAVLAYGSKRFGFMTSNDRGERIVDIHSSYAAVVTAGYFLLVGVVRVTWREYQARKRTGNRNARA
jgi:hypothetical protein